jgi:large subunit ribosomal protein L24e
MVIKTDICSFSEYRIYPGRGTRFIAKDGRTFLFINKKCLKFSLRKIKAQRITWTTAWRKHNKKVKTEDVGKKKKRRNLRVQRAIVGISLEDIRKKRKEKPDIRKAQAEEALREIKERQHKQVEKRKVEKKNIGPKVTKKAEPKQAQQAQKKSAKAKGKK